MNNTKEYWSIYEYVWITPGIFIQILIFSALKLWNVASISYFLGNTYAPHAHSVLVSQRQQFVALRLGRTIRRGARALPFKDDCVVQALAAQILLKIHHIPSVMTIGVQPDASRPSKVLLHAWLTSGPVYVTGGASSTNLFPVGCFYAVKGVS